MYLCYVVQCYNALEAAKLIHFELNAYRIAANREIFKHSLDKIKSVIDNVCGKFKLCQQNIFTKSEHHVTHQTCENTELC